ncbi:transglutaminaseTgpA domain-containing protein [Curtobacterium sp. RRHDQ10]|uniref:transglutaminase family protein n=1 Tax=Curtobacterium phyllosphaerae TaxID=3413379 RepID=UPI003BF372CC
MSTTQRPPHAASQPPRVTGRMVLERDDRADGDPGLPSAWLVVAAPVPVLVASLALRPLVQGIAWWMSALVVTVVVVAVMLAFRQRSRLARFVALVVTLVAGSSAAALLNDVQPFGWLDRNGALGAMLEAIRVNPAPLPETDAIRLEMTVLIVWVAGVSVFLAVIAPTAALAAVPALVILVVPGVITGSPAGSVLVVLTGIAFLLLLWLSVRPIQHAFPAVVIGVLGLVVAVGLPSVVPLNASWLSGVTGAIQAPLQPGRPGTLLKLGDDLRRPTEIEVFRYRTSSGSAEYLKLADLDEFGTGDWVPTVVDASSAPTADQGQSAVGVNPRLATRGDAEIRITGLSSQYLPVPSGAVAVQSQSTTLDLANWRWMGDSNTIRSTGPVTRRADLYSVYGGATFANPYLDAIAARGRLDAAGRGADWVQPSKAQLRTDLQLPRDLPASIRNAAERVAGNAGDEYEQGRALEDWFRGGRFTYSETAPVEQGYDGDSMAVIAKFLQVRAGYCVHFASSMAVMARVLGIPSRIAVGYRPGGTDQNGEFSVSNRQLHSWPELYIQGAGWVGFEPTPVDETGASNTQPSSAATPSALNTPSALPSANDSVPSPTAATPTPTVEPQSGGATGGPGDSGAGWGIGLGILALALVLVGPGLVRAVRRQRRLGMLGAGREPALHAWRELLDDVADHGFSPGIAPPDDAAAAARTARAVLGRLRTTLPPAVLPHLGLVVDAVDQERYGPAGSAGVDPGVLLAAVREARGALDAAVPTRRLVLSRIFPPSLAPSAAWSPGGPRRPRRV